MRVMIRAGCLSLVVLGFLGATASANTRSGNQNPDLVVTATIGPNHLDVGERAVWAVTITNTTSQAIRIRAAISVTTPTFDEEEGIVGRLGPGQSITEQHTVKARAGGDYVVTALAHDKNGSSHTRAHAVA